MSWRSGYEIHDADAEFSRMRLLSFARHGTWGDPYDQADTCT